MVSRRRDPIEDAVRAFVGAYLRQHGHGAAAILGRQIDRPSSWLGQFAFHNRRANAIDLVKLVAALRIRPNPFLDVGGVPEPPPIDETEAAHEARWLRLWRRMDPALRPLAVEVVEPLARQRGRTPPPTAARRHK